MSTKAKAKPKIKMRAVEVPPDTGCYLSKRAIAALLSINVRSLERMIAKGDYPACDGLILGKYQRWSKESHNAYCRRAFLSAKEQSSKGLAIDSANPTADDSGG